MSDSTTRECEKHGEFVARRRCSVNGRDFWTTCPACNEEYEQQEREREARVRERMRQEAEQRRQREAEERRQRLIRESNVPAKYANVNIRSDWKTDTRARLIVHEQLLQLLDDEPPEHREYGPGPDDPNPWSAQEIADHKVRCTVNIREGRSGAPIRTAILSGRYGTGKTMGACAMVNDLVQALCPALYVTERELIRRIRSTWNKGADQSEEECLRDLCRLDLLVIDDVGTSFGTEAEKAHLFDVLDGRYRGAGFLPDAEHVAMVDDHPLHEFQPQGARRLPG